VGAFEDTAARVLGFIADSSGAERVPSGSDFEELALAVFAFQYEHNPPFRRLCDRRMASPGRVGHWSEIPAVPTAAFKTLDLACAPAERVFLTSGTTRGGEARGRHLVPSLELYRRSALAHFRAMVLPDGVRPRVVGLLGSPETLPHSSLSQMVEWIREDVAGGDGEYLVDARGLDAAAAAERIETMAAAGRPLCLIGWRVAMSSVIAHCRQIGRTIALPADSRIVDTGGPKGGWALSDAGFLAACWHVFSVPGYACVNEYGMTELCSQLYDDVLAQRFAGSSSARRKVGPAWMRTRAVDPTSLAPLPEGEPGILCHLDLANAGSVMAVQTEDVGVIEDGRVRLIGRLPDAELRGCALALAELLDGSR
jgi:hypothetical protein